MGDRQVDDRSEVLAASIDALNPSAGPRLLMAAGNPSDIDAGRPFVERAQLTEGAVLN
jgi:hypothetical protein